MITQRHSARIEKPTTTIAFLPYQIISPHLRLRHHQLCREHALAEQHDGRIGFSHSLELLPHRLQRDDAVPRTALALLVEHAIRLIGDDAVHRSVSDALLAFEAVLVVYFVKFNHN